MNITYCDDYDSMSAQAASLVISEVEKHKDLLLCAPAGGSPTGLYEILARKAETDRAFFANLRVIKLDEWGGIPQNDPGSAESYLREHLVDPLGIPPDSYVAFATDPTEPAEECERIQSALDRHGPIDVCILGLGVNGHLGLNEPGPFLTPRCHVARLSEESQRHAMVRFMTRAPRYGLTLGMRDILASKTIVLPVTGAGKEQAIAGLLSGEITSAVPASFLWLHDNVECLIDRTVLANNTA